MRAVGFRRVCRFGPVLLLAIGGCPVCPEPLCEIIAGEPGVRLPLDEASHCFGGAEWWYYTGRLRATGGPSLGVEAVVFHVPQFPFTHLTGNIPTDPQVDSRALATMFGGANADYGPSVL